MTNGMDGGKMGPITAEAAVIAHEKGMSYPSFFICEISRTPRPDASATALPVMPAKISEARMLT